MYCTGTYDTPEHFFPCFGYLHLFYEKINPTYKLSSKFYPALPFAGLMGSAVCTFHLDAVSQAFEGKFKEQTTTTSAWLPVPSSKVPEPRPGACVEDTR